MRRNAATAQAVASSSDSGLDTSLVAFAGACGMSKVLGATPNAGCIWTFLSSDRYSAGDTETEYTHRQCNFSSFSHVVFYHSSEFGFEQREPR
jgi:hypothetical protein